MHYESLKNTINAVAKHNFTLVLGDFNAHLGTEDVPFSFHEKTNQNGQLLKELCIETGFLATNTNFCKKSSKLWTYISDMSGRKTQIDYILVNRKWKNSIHNCQAYNCFSSLGSDHRLVTAKIKISLRMCKTPQRKVRYDWSALRCPNVQELYTIEVNNRFSLLNETEGEEEVNNISEEYAHFVQAHQEATKLLIPKKTKVKKSKHSKDKQVISARRNVQEAFAKYEQNANEENQCKLQNAKDELEKAYTEVEEQELLRMIIEVEKANEQQRHKESWNIINSITGRKATKKGMIKGSSREERLSKWYNHFKSLLRKVPDETESQEDIPVILDDLDIQDTEFTLEELQSAKKSLKEGKSPGPDNIAGEIVKRCNFDKEILYFANKILMEGKKPEQLSEIDLLPIPKSGDLSDTKNYRGIALSSVVAKLINKMILNRLQPKIDEHLRNNQNGFRPSRSTSTHVLALRRLIEEVKANNKKAVVVYVDFKKAFDSVNRGMMLKILKSYGVPPNILNAISTMYKGTKAKIITPDGETDIFEITAGIIQGVTLAPYLFVIVLDYVLRKTVSGREEELGFKLERRRSRRVGPKILTDLDFADDIALISEEIDQAQCFLSSLEEVAGTVGLHCNSLKTEYPAWNQDPDRDAFLSTNDGKMLKQVNDFKYLGCRMESSEKDINVRKALAWVACNKLRKVWKSQLNEKIKRRLFLSTVESVLLFGSETWTLTEKLKKQLDGCYTRLLRMALNVNWREHVTNAQLYDSLPPISEKIQQRRMRIAGHCIRHPECLASELVLWKALDGVRN